ncbi:AraC family transcriptional regulator [Paenibacillus xylaniclasticus]|uniref:AraC family transcriptional regulator n=1 Tax=Paenibacillus xylaniclasticus TaxID=588083 RepID=UPI000FDB38C1|nr:MULTISPECIES: AraC family transcriptional regulator [Paenibacillus]GFN29889.1 HTH-type transcriptional activator Btr [Paenibacillus curdlanolyticus]
MSSQAIESNTGIHIESQQTNVDISQLTARLWDIELVRVKRGEKRGQQLLSTNAYLVILEGAGMLERGFSVTRMSADIVYRCKPETTFGLSACGNEEGLVAVIRFSLFAPSYQTSQTLYAVHADELLSETDGIVIEPIGKLAARCRTIYEHSRSEDSLIRWRAQHELQELLCEIIGTCRKQKRFGTSGTLERVRLWMEEHYMEDITIETLAGGAQLSPKYFADLFKKTYGVSALDMLLDIRMAKAKQLMLRSELRLRDIAHEVGYEDEFYFSRKFKRTYHISPSEYIKQRKRKIAVYGSTSTIGYLVPLNIIPHAAPLHPKWSAHYYDCYRADIPFHLDAFRQNQHRMDNVDKIAEAKPELIVTTPDLEPWEKKRLTEIAPTLVLPEEGPQAWKRGLCEVAAALGREDEAEHWIMQFEQHNKECRAQLAEQLTEQSVMVVRMLGSQLYCFTNQTIEDVMYGDLGVRRPDALSDRLLYGQRLTLDRLEQLQADYVLLLVRQDSETLSQWQRLRQSARWLALSVVHNNRLKLIQSNPWREYSPIGAQLTRTNMMELFSGECPS